MTSNGIVWDVNISTGGTFLRAHVENLSVAILERAAGYDAHGPHAYFDDENGYDGLELNGTFNGAVFSLYTRWGNLRIGGSFDLDVNGLIAALEAIR